MGASPSKMRETSALYCIQGALGFIEPFVVTSCSFCSGFPPLLVAHLHRDRKLHNWHVFTAWRLISRAIFVCSPLCCCHGNQIWNCERFRSLHQWMTVFQSVLQRRGVGVTLTNISRKCECASRLETASTVLLLSNVIVSSDGPLRTASCHNWSMGEIWADAIARDVNYQNFPLTQSVWRLATGWMTEGSEFESR
jgi:hypothetical protein